MSSRPKPKPKVWKPIDSSAHVAGEDEQVGPGELLAVLLLDRPQQPARLVEAGVVRPAVERREALGAAAAAAAAVLDAVGAGGVPAHPDEQRRRSGRSRPATSPARSVITSMTSRFSASTSRLWNASLVVEVLVQRVGPGRVLVQHRQVELVGPPVLVGPRPVRARVRGRDRRVLALARSGVVGHVWPPVSSRVGGGRRRCSVGACALGAPAPVDDLGLVDREARVVLGGQAGGGADGAVDVGDRAARPADHVVVVVADPGLVARHRARRLEAADQAHVGQRAQHVVDGLVGHVAGVAADGADERVGVGVRMTCTADSTASTAIRGRVTRRPTPRNMRSRGPRPPARRSLVALSGTDQQWAERTTSAPSAGTKRRWTRSVNFVSPSGPCRLGRGRPLPR